MLLLHRRAHESIHIGDQIVVKVIRLTGTNVVLGIAAPTEVRILRDELLQSGPNYIGPETNGMQESEAAK